MGEAIVVLHRWTDEGQRLLLANTGPTTALSADDIPALVAAPAVGWRVLLVTSDPRFGGSGPASGIEPGRFVLAPRTAILLAPDS